jgi:hypothetical protein
MAFALYEMKVVLASILASVRLRKRRAEPAKVSLRGFTMVPKGGTEVIVCEPSPRRRARVAASEVPRDLRDARRVPPAAQKADLTEAHPTPPGTPDDIARS